MSGLANAPIWVCWKHVIRDGKPTKPPFQSNGDFASTTDPKTWTTYQKAMDAVLDKSNNLNLNGVGIVFEPSQRIFGVDLDDFFKDKNLDQCPKIIQDFLTNAKTYIEYSPSGKGLHLLFKQSGAETITLPKNKHYFKDLEPITSTSDPPHIEIYNHGRFFTFTGDRIPGSASTPRTISVEEFEQLLQPLGYPWVKTITTTPTSTPTPTLNDQDILDKMFNSKNGDKIKALYNGDLSNHSNDQSSADFALCLHLSFWTNKDPSRIKSLWLASPLGNREKTQTREDYQDRTIQNAIDCTTETYSPKQFQKPVDGLHYDFFMTGGKFPHPDLILPNILKILRINPLFKDTFRKNDFSHMVETRFETPAGKWESLTDDAIIKIREYIATNFKDFRKLSREMTTDAILTVARDNKVNPPRDYFTSLVWDKTPRLNSWLHHTFGTPDDEVHQAMGSNWIKGLVKRVMQPGCQFDEALAVESPQGWRKSTAMRVLGAPWHVETTHSIDNKDFYLLLAQNMIVEFSEGEVFDRAGMKKIKAEITKTEDQVRPPYERGIVKFKRSCVFAVTTNDLELKDDTGNRRWLPVEAQKPADIDWLRANRDQLFAEAFHRVIHLRETTYEYPHEGLSELQTSHGEWTGYDEKALIWYATLSDERREEEGISLHDAIEGVYNDDRKPNKLDEMQIAGILRRTLHLDNKNKRLGSSVTKRWFPTDRTRRIMEGFVPPKEYDNKIHVKPFSYDDAK